MIDFELNVLEQQVEWRLVLEAYQKRTQDTDADQSDGWLSRVLAVEGVEQDRLAVIHGKLIALGFLQFQLQGRTEGVRYCLSASGRQALATLTERSEVVEQVSVA